ncbi:MAG: arsenate reductase ArsC [Planctomycetota bacterium]|nr:arsenate reductase ArsC [Planctomycetota bacterium]
MTKPKVLFLCTANSARSQMAEAILRKHAGDRFDVYSAGLEPTQVHPYATKVMAEIGIDMVGQRAKGVGEFLGKMNPAYVIIVCEKARQRCPTAFPATGATMIAWPIDDPAEAVGGEEERLSRFRETRDQIDARIRDWLEHGTRS